MLVLKVEMWPGGEPDRAIELSRIGIVNRGGSQVIADYDVTALLELDCREHVARSAVTAHERALGWAPLARRALLNLYMAEDLTRAVPYDDPVAQLLRKGSRG